MKRHSPTEPTHAYAWLVVYNEYIILTCWRNELVAFANGPFEISTHSEQLS